MIKKKTYIPSVPRNKNLSAGATTVAGVNRTEFNQVVGSSHEHPNKGVLDQITEAVLTGALRDLLTSTDEETELTDENILSSLRVLSEIAKNNEAFLEDLKERFLSKIETDTAQKLITFVEGLEVGSFSSGTLGSGAALKMVDGTSYAEVDNLTVRQKATFRELIIESLKHIGGQLVLTPARMKCVRVVEGDTFYKCYFDTGDGEVSNEFVAGDLARCQVFTGSGTKFYWRLVTLVGEDWINLSKTSAAEGSDAPEAGDDIAQLGNATDTERQSAIILSTVGIDAPSWKQYSGINSFSLEGKETTVFSRLGNRIEGKTVFTSGGSTNLDDYLVGVAQDILDALKAAQDAEDKAQQAIADAEANVGLINAEVANLQDQLDGEVSNWFYPYSPTLANYPASDWDTNTIKDRHIGDTFTNTQTFVDNATTPDAGKSWRFVKDGSVYSWTAIADSDAVKALLEASKAQATADGKSTTHLFQPTTYKLGDMWVLNSDKTVNGTAYKQGEILTATQDSETFNEAHWLKRVRYTDDTAVDNLEIGGRNLLIRSTLIKDRYLDQTTGNLVTFAGLYATDFIEVVGGADYTFFAKKNGTNNPYQNFRLAYYDINKTRLSGILFSQADEIYRLKTPINAAFIRFSNGGGSGYTSLIDGEFKVEKGTKATGWQLAPEDVQAEIDDVSTGLTDLGTEIDTAFSNLSITNIEANNLDLLRKSLAKEVADVRAIAVSMGVSVVDLDSKISALNTEVNKYAGKADSVYPITVTIANRTAIETAFSNLESSIVALYEAIDKKRVDDLEIGGRNLFRNSKKLRLEEYPNTQTQTYQDGWTTFSLPLTGILEILNSGFVANPTVTPGATYTGSMIIKTDGVLNESSNLIWSWHLGNHNTVNASIKKIATGEYLLHSTYKVKDNETSYSLRFPDLMNIQYLSITGGTYISFGQAKLELGNKATAWTPAPEDIQAEIDGLEGYMEGAFQDSILDEGEKQKIRAYLQSIEETMGRAESQFAKIFGNTLLRGTEKTDLENAKINLWGRRTLLVSAINTALESAKLTETQIDNVNNYLNGWGGNPSFSVLMKSFQDAIEEARKAIEKQRVDDLDIGGVNLLKDSKKRYITQSFINVANLNSAIPLMKAGQKFAFSCSVNIQNATAGGQERIGFEMQVTYEDGTPGYLGAWRSVAVGETVLNERIHRIIRIPKDVTQIVHMIAYPNFMGGVNRWVENIQIEVGNKPTAYREAPEDVDAYINAARTAAIKHADTLAHAQRNILDRTGELDATMIDSVGGFTHYPGSALSAVPISVTPGERLIFYKTDSSLADNAWRYAFYDGDGNFIIRYNPGNSFHRRIVPDGAATLRAAYPENSTVKIERDVDFNAMTAQLAAEGYMRARYIRDWVHGNNADIHNRWYEIKVVNKAGVNLAKNILPESSQGGFHESYPLANITDGDISTGAVRVNDAPTEQWVEIDLGQIHYDIDYIQVWHARNSDRIYYGTKTEISEDGVNWVTIFDSAVEGTYPEAEEGKIHTQRYASVVSNLNRAKATTDKFSGFDGGLATAVIMEMREPSTTTRGDATAGISGVQGVAKNLPAIWAGGTYQQALSNSAKAIIRHDGSSKFTDTEITGEVNATSGKVGGFTISGNSLVNASTDARITFDGLDGGQSFIRLNISSSMLSIRTDVSNKTGLNISTYATGAVGLSIISNAGSALAIRSVGGHYFYQRSAEVWSSPGVLAAVELQFPGIIVTQTWAVHGVTASGINFAVVGSGVTWTHNLGHTDYVLIPANQSSNGHIVVGERLSNSVSFTLPNYASGEKAHLLLIGRNKYVSI